MTPECGKCGAQLNLAGVRARNVECEYCHGMTLLSDEVWTRVRPREQDPAHQHAQEVRAHVARAQRMGARLSLWITLGTFLFIGAIVGFSLYMANKAQQRVQQRVQQSIRQASSGAGIGPARNAPEPGKAIDIEKVELVVESTPDGAEVYIDGKRLVDLLTPAKIQQRKSDDVLLIKVVKAGYAPRITRITPDKNQSVSMVMEKR